MNQPQKQKPKKTKIDHFRDQIHNVNQLLSLAETPPGFLKLLLGLLSKIQTCTSSAKIYRFLLEDISREDRVIREHKERLVTWMTEKVAGLKQSAFYELSPFLKEVIDEAELSLKHGVRDVLPSGSYFQMILGKFEAACHAAGYFGERGILDSCAEMTIRKTWFGFEHGEIPQGICKKKLDPKSKSGQKLVKKLGQGFIRAANRKNGFCHDEIFFDVEYGLVDRIKYPEESYRAWWTNESLAQWQISEDCTPAANLRFLILLAQHSDMKPITIAEPKSVFEGEELTNYRVLQFFLSGFSTNDWNKAPKSREEIAKMIKRLIAFIEEEIVTSEAKAIRGPREMTEEAREFIWSVLEEVLLPMSRQERKEYTYSRMRTIIWNKAALSNTPGLQKACSCTLIRKQCTLFAQKHKWRPKRGGGKKDPSG